VYILEHPKSVWVIFHFSRVPVRNIAARVIHVYRLRVPVNSPSLNPLTPGKSDPGPSRHKQ